MQQPSPKTSPGAPDTDRPDPDEVSVVRRLAACPSVATRLAEHTGYYEEILPHVFLAELAAWAGERPAEASSVLRALEVELEQHPAVAENLVAVGFVEALRPAVLEPVRRVAGPRLAALCAEAR